MARRQSASIIHEHVVENVDVGTTLNLLLQPRDNRVGLLMNLGLALRRAWDLLNEVKLLKHTLVEWALE